jgi:hypothetical protein
VLISAYASFRTIRLKREARVALFGRRLGGAVWALTEHGAKLAVDIVGCPRRPARGHPVSPRGELCGTGEEVGVDPEVVALGRPALEPKRCAHLGCVTKAPGPELEAQERRKRVLGRSPSCAPPAHHFA